MTKKEQEIINACRSLPKSGYGDYHYGEELQAIIAKAMGYRVIHFSRGRSQVARDDFWNYMAILKGMKKRGIISWSKNGSMWKLNTIT